MRSRIVRSRLPWLGLGLLMLYGLGVVLLGWWLNWQQTDWLKTADVLARYTLAIPGAALTAWGLIHWSISSYLASTPV